MIRRVWFEVLGRLRGMPPGAASSLEAISLHADGVFGQQAQHLHEKYSPDIHVDLLHYRPSNDRPFHYVLTSGMSDQPMGDIGQAEDDPRLELVMALPPHWNISPEGIHDPATWQPLKLMKSLARYPFLQPNGFSEGRHRPAGRNAVTGTDERCAVDAAGAGA